ncbi:ABC transporter permease [Paenibacillus caui]|uniref:ABC transporter permease n=1 Tax=Paenibacillus caui TaxID=2873927 RepID=UPI001CA7F4E5|nr:ABC transporter permease [Paenibacillus caui]
MKFWKRIVLISVGLLAMMGSFVIFNYYDQDNSKVQLSFEIMGPVSDDYQLFFITNDQNWKEENSIHKSYDTPGKWKEIQFDLPKDTTRVRIDLGMQTMKISMKNLAAEAIVKEKIDLNLHNTNLNQLVEESHSDYEWIFLSKGKDPYIDFEFSSIRNSILHGINYLNIVKNVFLSVLTGIVVSIILRYLRTSLVFGIQVARDKKLIFSLAKNDFRTKYASSYLGVVWGFITPLLTIVTYWFVFQVGLRSGNVANVPFILWFIAGIIPWFFFSDAFSGATNALTEYSYLVKKVVFRIELLPSVKIVSALFVQFFFIGFIFIVYAFYGYYPKLYSFQLLYYLFCMIILVFALSFLTSSIVLFFKDLNQIIGIVLQIGFWFTPIGWPVTMLPNFWANIFKLNPMFYIVQGFRDTLIDDILFYQRPYQTLYFWVLCFGILTLGVITFKKLKPHFSDVL